jgi:acetolactate synthase-1/2/3 large subunit
MPVYDELYKFKDQLHHVLVRHEQGATHAGLCKSNRKSRSSHCYVSAQNLVTGIADAQIDSTYGLYHWTSRKHLLGSDAFQETDIIEFQPQ